MSTAGSHHARRLTRHGAPGSASWALDGHRLPAGTTLGTLLALPHAAMTELLARVERTDAMAAEPLLAPIEPHHEVWASGVTYLRSREARVVESSVADIYERVYDAQRPELFFKALGHRVVTPGGTVRIRRDSAWNVPEPELVLVLNHAMEIVGYTAGNDMSSRDIEGANPLYLPQAKVYEGSCALGPEIVLAGVDQLRDLEISLQIARHGRTVFSGAIGTSQMKRSLEELAAYLGLELCFPEGAFLMTGTGIVPPDDFTLARGDVVRVSVGAVTMQHAVTSAP